MYKHIVNNFRFYLLKVQSAKLKITCNIKLRLAGVDWGRLTYQQRLSQLAEASGFSLYFRQLYYQNNFHNLEIYQEKMLFTGGQVSVQLHSFEFLISSRLITTKQNIFLASSTSVIIENMAEVVEQSTSTVGPSNNIIVFLSFGEDFTFLSVLSCDWSEKCTMSLLTHSMSYKIHKRSI